MLHPALSYNRLTLNIWLRRFIHREPCFQEAITALNSLQSNASVLKQVALAKSLRLHDRTDNVPRTLKYLNRCGIDVGRLEDRVIHVAGTKGKGSTCAYCESILRHKGYRTGLFTSPHLVSVTERIRIDGRPISQPEFARYFWRVYNRLVNNKDDENDMPMYFKFLTVMALDVFLEEEVDIAIIEVGIGGEHDCTNVFQSKRVAGITSLGLDHTNVLGDTLESIAWQKAGIMTPDCLVFTASNQQPSALSVLKTRAAQKRCRLIIAPNYEEYQWPTQQNGKGQQEYQFDDGFNSMSDMDADRGCVLTKAQLENTSLAIQLAHAWISLSDHANSKRNTLHHSILGISTNCEKKNYNVILDMDEVIYNGIQNCKWLGRYQKLTVGRINYFIDGAHTQESIQLAALWFRHHSPPGSHLSSVMANGNRSSTECQQAVSFSSSKPRVLVFNCTGKRNVKSMLTHLVDLEFSHVFFTTNCLYDEDDVKSQPPDVRSMVVSREEGMDKCREHARVWVELTTESNIVPNHEICTSVNSALDRISKIQADCDVFITGSLHLVGAALALLKSAPS